MVRAAGLFASASSPALCVKHVMAERLSRAEAKGRGIARYPNAVSAIMHAAVEQAPAHRDEVVHRASIAFPGFASQIAAIFRVTREGSVYD